MGSFKEQESEKVFYLKEIFMMAQKRNIQLQGSLEEKGSFWRLDLLTRSCLYLKYKEKLSQESIALICNLGPAQVISLIQTGKRKFFSHQGLAAGNDFQFM